jgi:hypothetical protein
MTEEEGGRKKEEGGGRREEEGRRKKEVLTWSNGSAGARPVLSVPRLTWSNGSAVDRPVTSDHRADLERREADLERQVDGGAHRA